MSVVFSYKDAAIFASSNTTVISRSSGSIIDIDAPDHENDNPTSLSLPQWDPSFHGSVHTATMAVCTVLVIFVVVLGTFGNGLVLISALQSRKLRSKFDLFVYNLAGADLIVCSCLAPTFLYLLFVSPPPAPREFCGGFLFACILCGLASLLTLMIIAGHRRSRVTGMAKGALTAKRAAAILVAIYVISLTAALGGMLRVTLTWPENQTSCQSVLDSSPDPRDNVILVFVTPVVSVSCVAILVAYCVIARAVRTQTYMRVKSLQPLLQSSTYTKLTPAPEAERTGKHKYSPASLELAHNLVEAGEQVDTAREQASARPAPAATNQSRLDKKESLRHCACCSCMAALDKENKAITMCLVVILIIALCWTPLVVSHSIELFTGKSIILYQVKLCGIALIFLNSALNPYLYAQNCGRSSHRYGSFLWDLFRCGCRLPRFSKTKVRHTAGEKSAFPRTRTVRSQAGIPTSAFVLRPDYATLQFLNPTDAPFRDKSKIVKASSGAAGKTNNCILKPSRPKSRRVRTKTKHHHGVYTNNLLQFGQVSLEQGRGYKMADVHHTKRAHAQAGVMSDVKTLVHKSCCHGNCPDDLSLIDS